MNKPLIPARTAKFIGVSVLAASLLAVSTGCSAGGAKDGVPAASAASTTATASATPSAETKKPLVSQFVKVIDGDTIEVRPVSEKNGQPTGEPNVKVHMLGTTAPEANVCGGAEATQKLTSLLGRDTFLTVTYEPTLHEDVDKDGNILAYVITGGSVTEDIGQRMVREGYAAASYPEGKTVPKDFDQTAEAGKIAVDQKKGIWATCPAPKV